MQPSIQNSKSTALLPDGREWDATSTVYFAGDGNSRLQILDQEGTWLVTWTQFGRPSGLSDSAHG